MQASIVIITTAAGKLQDDSPSDSLDPAVTLWLVYAFLSVAISGALLFLSSPWAGRLQLSAGRLSQVPPRELAREIERLAIKRGHVLEHGEDLKTEEKRLKSPKPGREGIRWLFLAASIGIIFVGWIMFGMGVNWGVHGSVVAGTTGE